MARLGGSNGLPANSNIGDITVSTTPDQVANQISTEIATNENFSIPAGQLKVKLKNLGGSNNSAHAAATVNGDRLEVGQEMILEMYRDTSTNPPTTKKTPLINIVTNGAWIEGFYLS